MSQPSTDPRPIPPPELNAHELDNRREVLKHHLEKLENEREDLEYRLQNNNFPEETEEWFQRRSSDINYQLPDIRRELETLDKRIKERVRDGDSIIDERAQLKAAVSEADEILASIQSTQNEAEGVVTEIRDIQSEISQTSTNIQSLQETAQGLLERTTSAALGEQFADRKEELEQVLKYWKIASIGSILLLLTASTAIYFDISGSSQESIVNLSKVALILPISVAVWFSVSNYSRQKRLMEEYEFKARMALSLTGFREVLNDEFPEEHGDKVGEFMTSTMERIHSNPQENIHQEDGQTSQSPLTTGQSPLVELIRRTGK